MKIEGDIVDKYFISLADNKGIDIELPTDDIKEVWQYFENWKYAISKYYKVDNYLVFNIDFIVAISKIK